MKMSKPFGDNGFCGPLVLSVLSGKSTDECGLLASKTGKPLGPMFNHQLQDSLELLGISFQRYKSAMRRCYISKYNRTLPYPTLKQWMDQFRRPSEHDMPFVVVITGHYILVKGDKICDTFTNGQWVHISQYKRKSSHVRGFIKILDEFSVLEQE